MKRPPLNTIDFDVFASSLAQESDRACAVLGAAWLDARLEDLLRRRMSGEPEELLGPSRALQSFSSRIRLAHCLSWIDADTRADLDSIRSIRNDFAHSFDHSLSFETPSVADRCRTLHSAAAFLDGVSESAKHQPNFSVHIFDAIHKKFARPRWRFQVAVESIGQVLRDLPDLSLSYSGPSLKAEVFASSASQRFRVQATATVANATESPSPAGPPSEDPGSGEAG
jgi:hypothetical protein